MPEELGPFFRHMSGAEHFVSHSACFACLVSQAEHTLPCGHVLCKSCVGQFMKPTNGDSMRCYVCEADLTEKETAKKEGKEKIQPGLVELRREGTGFSAGGSNQVKKDAVMFRC